MGNILNFIFEDIKNPNGYGTREWQASAIYNWIKDRLIHHNLSINNNIACTSNYEIREDCNNIFLLECTHELRDLWCTERVSTSKTIYNTFPDKFKKLIQSGKVKLLIACVSEATTNLDHFEVEVEKFCKVHSIPIDSLLFTDGNMLIEKCKKIKGFYTPHFIYDCSANISQLIKKRIKFYEFSPTLPTISESENKLDRDYYFLSLNKNWRDHRALLGCYFIEKNDDRILWSFCCRQGEHIDTQLLPRHKLLYNNNVRELNRLIPKLIIPREIEKLEELKKIPDVTQRYLIDKVSDFAHSYLGSHDRELYLNSYFQIVTETEFPNSGTIFFTEKIMKPLMNLQPFIVITSSGFIKSLKSLGFKTYDGLFDESYDDIENRWERFDFIIKEIDKILSKSPEEVRDLYEKYFEICVYNRNHLIQNFNLGHSKHYDKLCEEILGEIQ
jgi:hypothetical protein